MPIDRNQLKSGDRVQFKTSTLPGTPTGEITGTVSNDPLNCPVGENPPEGLKVLLGRLMLGVLYAFHRISEIAS
ncbi:hypothetical protein BC936DRAFT_147447 [Jimgerdemannia flammicorona]|uniref:Uncharacterized protein n=1 Tax=Jimgerdemannia flammicorona TaxID=994334 RepID=A0A433D5F3_9FUNG|nr:hypothetical protein BC936DRAFT_147447 [Jimgerdemannia flammicorona]